jgi:hypothetical protein
MSQRDIRGREGKRETEELFCNLLRGILIVRGSKKWENFSNCFSDYFLLRGEKSKKGSDENSS